MMIKKKDAAHDQNQLEKLEKLTEIGIALSSEQNTQRLLEMILVGAKSLTRADGGTLYSVDDEGAIRMEIVRTDSLNYEMGGTSSKKIPFPPLYRYDKDGNPNNKMVVTYAVNNHTTINIADAYHTDGFDFSGTRKFDDSTGYHSKSFLTIPMKNHEGDIIGVLQLINAQDPVSGEIIAFDSEAQRLTESLASLAAIALTNRRLIDDLKTLLESLIQLIAGAIDDKSPYTGGHCRRVPELTMMLAEAANQSHEGIFKDFSLNDDDFYELSIAAWLHDCGKITTPEYVVDKSSKLETIYDRIETVKTRYEILKRDAKIRMLEAKIERLELGEQYDDEQLQKQFNDTIQTLDEELRFLQRVNIGSEFMTTEDQLRVAEIAKQEIEVSGYTHKLLCNNEVKNLTISKGTLTDEEREVINHHIVATIKMLESLPFPKHLRNVPEYAGGHHERIDGKGYPQGLTADEMSLQARMLAIADIFEALTATDRPYKSAKTLSESIRILGVMKENHHIDPDLFNLFIDQKIYLNYAQKHLKKELIDELDTDDIPGYIPPEKRQQ